MYIKICDIKDIHTARLCGNAEVEMIGLHAIRKLKRRNIKPYRLICNEMRAYYPRTHPVLVTKMKDPQKLVEILKRISVDYIQIYVLDEKSLESLNNKLDNLEFNNLSSDVSPEQMQELDKLIYEFENVKRQVNLMLNRKVKFILSVPILGVDIKFTKYIIRKTKMLADLFLLDTSVVGGTGITADVEKTKYLLKETRPKETLIAGGLNPENVLSVIQNLVPLQPTGVDVQSGVADLQIDRGNPKNPQLLFDFISLVHSQSRESIKKKGMVYPISRKFLLSWAITDLKITNSLSRIFSIMRKTDIDTVHIDFSNGSIAPSFIRMPFSLLEYFTYYFPCMNYDIHLFIRNVEDQNSVITDCLKRNILLKTAYFHVLPNDNLLVERLDSISNYCSYLGINLGLAIQSTQFNTHTLKQLYEVIFARKSKPQISEISLITHSKRHLLSSAIDHDRRILSSLLNNNEIFSVCALISIDRDMTLEKTQGLLQTECVNQIIVGKDLNDKINMFLDNKTDHLTATFIQNHINRYRKILKNAESRNAN